MKSTSLIIILIILSAAIFRIVGFNSPHFYTFDESLYTDFGSKFMSNSLDYNFQQSFKAFAEKGRELPAYLNKPIFKHPPLYPMLLSLSFSLFGVSYFSAFLVSLFFGVMLVLLTYFLGRDLFNKEVGLIACFAMLIEPVNWLCSQKIWLETTLSFFTVLALYLFLIYVKNGKKSLFILLSAISIGFAALTKYPGMLSLIVIILYSLIFDRSLFKRKFFIFCLFVPFLMLVPWLFWNYKVYGISFLFEIYKTHNIIYRFNWLRQKELIYGLFAIIIMFFSAKSLKFVIEKYKFLFSLFIVSIFFFIFQKNFINAFNLFVFPRAGWKIMMFNDESPIFYIGQLLELYPLYLFVFIIMPFYLLLNVEEKKNYYLIVIASLVIMLFYMWWKVYQSRYILSLIPFLIILGSMHVVWVWSKISTIKNISSRSLLKIVFSTTLFYLIVKSLVIDFVLVLPNGVCYF